MYRALVVWYNGTIKSTKEQIMVEFLVVVGVVFTLMVVNAAFLDYIDANNTK